MIAEIAPKRQIVLARELTKKFEEYLRGTAQEILTVADELKGEMVLVLSGEKNKRLNLDLSLEEHLLYYLNNGLPAKEAITLVAQDRDIPKREVYGFYHNNLRK